MRNFTARMGYLIPIHVQDVLPGDSFRMSSNLLIRFSPLLAPVMSPVRCRIHHWYVPYRLLWDKWEEFIINPDSGLEMPVIYHKDVSFNPSTIFQDRIYDYMGIPEIYRNPNESGDYYNKGLGLLAFPFIAYNMIWNNFYRDQDLQEERPIDISKKVYFHDDFTLLTASWSKDVFTTARPWTQKGEAVSVPVNAIEGSISNISIEKKDPRLKDFISERGTRSNIATSSYLTSTPPNTIIDGSYYTQSFVTPDGLLSNTGSLPATRLNLDLSNLKGVVDSNFKMGSVDIMSLRLATAMQRFKENQARWGTRYNEYLQFLGVRPSDARLQLPEYLGGGRSTIMTSEVVQTAPGNNQAGSGVVGSMAGYGLGAMRSNRWTRFFEEHGVILSLMVVQPDSIYSNGIPRYFLKRNFYDIWQKDLQHIGQQEVFNGEVFASHYPTLKENLTDEVLFNNDPRSIFGYQDRYYEYRKNFNTIHGEFRNRLSYWHFARNFDSPPALNSSFIDGSSATLRPFADHYSDPLLCMAQHKIVARRLVTKRPNPRLIG